MNILLTPFELLSRSWITYRQRMWTLLGISLIPIILAALTSFLIVAMWYVSGSMAGLDKAVVTIGAIILAISLAIGVIYLSLLSQVGLIIAIRDSKEKIGIKEALKRARGNIGSYFWALFLAGLAVLGGYILFIIPGIIFTVWFAFAGYIVLTEGKKGSAALSQSREYTKGLWWEIAVRILFIFIISLIISAIFSVGELFGGTAGNVSSLLQTIVSAFLAPLYIIYSYSLYLNIKAIKAANPQAKGEGSKTLGFFVLEFIILIVLFGIIMATSISTTGRKAQEQLDKRGEIEKVIEKYQGENGLPSQNIPTDTQVKGASTTSKTSMPSTLETIVSSVATSLDFKLFLHVVEFFKK